MFHQGAVLLQRAVTATPPPGGRGFESEAGEQGSAAGLYSSVGDRTAVAAAGGGGATAEPPGAGGDGVRALTGCVLSVLIVSTLLGNTLVCAAVVKFRHLRSKVTNSFVISLAVSDLFVAVLVMPWRAASQVAGRWLFGAAFCDTWVACDIMCSTASILNLCVISVDRYWAISAPFRYERKMTRRVATTMIGLAWTLSVMISFIPVRLNWHRQTGLLANETLHDDQDCNPSLNRTYAISSSLISFYIPVVIMVGTYTRIFRIAQTQIRRISSLERAARQRAAAAVGVGVGQQQRALNQNHALQHLQHHRSHRHQQNHTHQSQGHAPHHGHAPHQSHTHRGASNSTANHHHEESALKTSFKKETKVLKTLSIIMGVFVFCWLPFFVLNCVVPFCGGPDGAGPDGAGPGGAGPPCVSDTTFSIFVWFGWANSSLNPVIYAFNADFRRAFSTILGCNKLCSSSAVEAVDFSNELVSYQHDTTMQKETTVPAGTAGGGAAGGAGVTPGGGGGGGAGACLGPRGQHATATAAGGEQEEEEEEEEEEGLGMAQLLRFECEAEISLDMMPFNSSGAAASAARHAYPAIPGQVGDL